MSFKKIHIQMDYLTNNRLPGLLNGFSSNKNNDKNLTDVNSGNSTLCWLSGSKDSSDAGSKRSSCEVHLNLCYAGRPFPVRLLFTPRQPWMPPDFLIVDNGFVTHLTLQIVERQLSSLAQWPHGKEDALAEIVRELYALYRHYQVLLMSSDRKQLFVQYRQIETELDIPEDGIEVLITPTEQILCVRLPLDWQRLPPSVFPEERGTASCVLQLVDAGCLMNFVPQLLMSPRAESLLCGEGSDHLASLPPVPSDCASLAAYAASIVVMLNDLIKQAHVAFEIRKQIVAQLLCRYDAAIIQYDTVRFTSIELLLQDEVDDFHYLVDITFPPGFPHDCGPRVRLRSICQEKDEEAVSAQVPGVPHSADSDPDEVLQAVLRAATTYAPVFRRQRCLGGYSSR